jgi:hypothetical protein
MSSSFDAWDNPERIVYKLDGVSPGYRRDPPHEHSTPEFSRGSGVSGLSWGAHLFAPQESTIVHRSLEFDYVGVLQEDDLGRLPSDIPELPSGRCSNAEPTLACTRIAQISGLVLAQFIGTSSEQSSLCRRRCSPE